MLGADAIGDIRRLERRSSELDAWEDVGRATAIDEHTAAALGAALGPLRPNAR